MSKDLRDEEGSFVIIWRNSILGRRNNVSSYFEGGRYLVGLRVSKVGSVFGRESERRVIRDKVVYMKRVEMFRVLKIFVMNLFLFIVSEKLLEDCD